MSFSFTVREASYDSVTHTRTITKVKKLYDVSAVDIPAYNDTSISARSFFEEEHSRELAALEDVYKRQIIHVRRHFLEHDIFGDGNKPLDTALKTANTLNQSMSKFAELVAVIRGILKVSNAVKTEDLNLSLIHILTHALRRDTMPSIRRFSELLTG